MDKLSEPICYVCGGVVENWKGKPPLKPSHRSADGCLASALIRLSNTKKLLKQVELFVPHNQLNMDLIQEVKQALEAGGDCTC